MRQASEFPRDKCSIVSKSRQHAPRMQEREWIYVAPLAVCASKWSFRRSYLRCNKPERSLVRTREDRWCVSVPRQEVVHGEMHLIVRRTVKEISSKMRRVKTLNREKKSWQASVNFFPFVSINSAIFAPVNAIESDTPWDYDRAERMMITARETTWSHFGFIGTRSCEWIAG